MASDNWFASFRSSLGFNQVDIPSLHFGLGDDSLEAPTSSQGYMMLTPQQPAAGGAPASAQGSTSAQGSMQSQMQAPLLQSNDTSVASVGFC